MPLRPTHLRGSCFFLAQGSGAQREAGSTQVPTKLHFFCR